VMQQLPFQAHLHPPLGQLLAAGTGAGGFLEADLHGVQAMMPVNKCTRFVCYEKSISFKAEVRNIQSSLTG
jgi:hypothetical protein